MGKDLTDFKHLSVRKNGLSEGNTVEEHPDPGPIRCDGTSNR